MTKVTKNQKAIMFLNIHASTNMPQNVVSKNLKKLQGKRVNPQLYQDILNIYLSIIDRTNKTSEWLEKKSKITTLDPINIYRSLYSEANKYTFFLSIHGTFVKTTICCTIKQISKNSKETISCKMLSNDNAIKKMTFSMFRNKDIYVSTHV